MDTREKRVLDRADPTRTCSGNGDEPTIHNRGALPLIAMPDRIRKEDGHSPPSKGFLYLGHRVRDLQLRTK